MNQELTLHPSFVMPVSKLTKKISLKGLDTMNARFDLVLKENGDTVSYEFGELYVQGKSGDMIPIKSVINIWYWYNKKQNVLWLSDCTDEMLTCTSISFTDDKNNSCDAVISEEIRALADEALIKMSADLFKQAKELGLDTVTRVSVPKQYRELCYENYEGELIPLRSTYVGTADFNKNDVFVNAKNTTGDHLYIKNPGGGREKSSKCWIGLWSEKTGKELPGYCNACNACIDKKPVLGGHVIKGAAVSREAIKGETIYIDPICSGCNNSSNTAQMTAQYATKVLSIIWEGLAER